MRKLALIPLAVLTLAACGGGTKISTPEGEVNVEDGEVTFEGEDGDVQIDTGGNAELPENFPSDVPLPEDFSIISAADVGAMSGQGETGWVVSGSAPADADAVTDFYKKELPAKGWTIEGDLSTSGESGAGAVYTANKAGRMLNVAIGGSDVPGDEAVEGTAVTLTVSAG